MANDKELLRKIGLLSNLTFSFYKDVVGDERQGEIRFHVLKNPFRWIGGENIKIGLIEMGMLIDPKRIEKYKVNYEAKSKMQIIL